MEKLHLVLVVAGLLAFCSIASASPYYITSNPQYVPPAYYSSYYDGYSWDYYNNSAYYSPYAYAGYGSYYANAGYGYGSYYANAGYGGNYGYAYPYTTYPTPSYYWMFDTWNTPWYLYGYNTPYYYGSGPSFTYYDYVN